MIDDEIVDINISTVNLYNFRVILYIPINLKS